MLHKVNALHATLGMCVRLCATHPRGSGVCVTMAARHCAAGTSECNALANPPSQDASTIAESSGQSGSVYLPGRTKGERAEGRKQGHARGMSQTACITKIYVMACLLSSFEAMLRLT